MADPGLHAALEEVERELLTTHATLKAVQQRIAHLRQAQAGLRGLLNQEGGGTTVLVGQAKETDRALPITPVKGNLSHLIVRVLYEAGRPMESEEVIRRIHEEEGKYSDGSVYETMRVLATEKDSPIERVARNKYAHVLSFLLDETLGKTEGVVTKD